MSRAHSYIYGMRAETIAAWWLRAKLYRILATRYRAQGGEIDVIAQRGSTLCFVEVKARPTLDEAMIAITPDKRRRMSRAARGFLATHRGAENCTWRGDAVLIAPGKPPRHAKGVVELEI
ncbi:MAG: YraN family protein [Hyphomicrobiales bacterium]|nr:YraN family protein [Hyphomicrobiales bacterium]